MIPVYISSHFWWSQTTGRQPWEMALLLGRYQVHRHILLPQLLVHVQVAKGNEEVQEVRQKLRTISRRDNKCKRVLTLLLFVMAH